MRFSGRFTDQLLANRPDWVSLSFLVDDLVVCRGVGANIAFGGGVPRLEVRNSTADAPSAGSAVPPAVNTGPAGLDDHYDPAS